MQNRTTHQDDRRWEGDADEDADGVVEEGAKEEEDVGGARRGG